MTKLSDDELLGLVKAEMRAAIGFENDSALIKQREDANNYVKGYMPDVPSRPKRSSAVSTDVADAIETILPQILDIFIEEDSIKFTAEDGENEDDVQFETDYVKNVLFGQNDSFLNIYTAVKDALQQKMGHFKWWWDEGKPGKPQRIVANDAAELAYHQEQNPDAEVEGNEDGTYSLTKSPPSVGRVCIKSFDPNNFAICRDATNIGNATYVAVRSNPRAQDLLAMGISADKVYLLPAWSEQQNNSAEIAKDTVQETSQGLDSPNDGYLRQVCVVEHYLRIKDASRETIYQVLTDYACANVLRVEQVEDMQMSAGTPFIVTHRFYGESIADKLMEIQRIKTALLRMALDNGYFALNRRPAVVDKPGYSTPDTMSDLLLNEPGRPIRIGQPGAIEWPQGGALDFDAWAAFEQASVMSEQRTGIMRNAQGLNPDTMHDTASGALALLSAAQRRVRMIAKVLAETLIKDTLLGIHKLLRQYDPKFANVPERTKMTIEIGPGGPEHDLMAAQTIGAAQQAMAEGQGGINGPLQNPDSLRATGMSIARALGRKNPDQFFPDPASYQPPNGGQPPPDAAMLKVQADAQAQQQQQQLDEAKAVAEHQNKQRQFDLQTQQAQSDAELKAHQIQVQDQFQRDQGRAELQARQVQFEQSLQLEREKFYAQLELDRERLAHDVAKHQMSLDSKETIASNVKVGGEVG